MIGISHILSRRGIKHRPSWHLVFEWEDEIARSLGIPVRAPGRAWWLLAGASRWLRLPSVDSHAPALEFIMIAKPQRCDRYGADSIPWIIDYFLDDEDTRRFIEATAHCRKVLLSSREAYEKVIGAGGDPRHYLHVPLSLPDRYRLNPDTPMKKDFDLALVGRSSVRLEEWARRYVSEHPGLRVVMKGPKRDGHYWVYDQEGQPVADVDRREDYLDILRRSRLFLYSTPGVDDGKPTGGYSQVTPRLLEALACGCQPLMRYPDNPDTRWYRLDSLCPSLESYEEFAAAADRALAIPVADALRRNADYLDAHYTSSTVKEALCRK